MLQKTAVYRGYINTPTFRTDNTATSPDVFAITEFPERLTAGKNVIKFRGREDTLQPGSLIQVEVLDYNGDPIYSEILANYIDEDKARVIVIWVYEDTSPGDATVTLLSTLRNVPAEWKNKPNVKWTRSVAVNPTAPNVSEIIFETEPTIRVSEQVGVQLNRTYTSGQFPTYAGGTITYTDRNFKRIAVVAGGGTFTSDMVGGTLTVASPTNPQSTPRYPISNNTYTSTIKKVLSRDAIELDAPYTVFSSQSIFSHTYNSFGPSAYTIDYEATPTYTPTQNSESFAYVEIEGLQPASGDVSRIKVYASGKGTVGTYELTNDIELVETEIFVPSTSSVDPYTNIGSIINQNVIDTYWESHTYLGRTETTAPILLYGNKPLINGIGLVSAIPIPRKNDVYVLQVSSSVAGKFIANSQYKVTFDAFGQRNSFSNNQSPKIHVYMSGSAFNYNTTDYYNQELPVRVGKKVGELEIRSNSQRIDDQTFYFKADRTGTGVLLFVIEAGQWSFSDIRTTTDNDPGYTPNYTRLRTEIPTKHKSGNQLSFKIEYYNVAGERSKLISFKNNLDWQGGNRYIDGDFSMITGSLYVADTLESGIAISGLTDTGFVRSLGYSGFETGDPGFLLWSGSALPGQNTKGGVPYSGVGLELFLDTSSYFRYSTADDELYVATKNFFLGDPNTSFISGSNSNIEISSSNFHLTADGNVTASNALFSGVALANVIRDATVIITAANSGSYLQAYNESDGSATPSYRVVLDGSLGGEIARRVRINCSLLRPIGDFTLPQIGSKERLDFILETNATDTYLLDTFNPRIGTIPLTWDQILLSQGSVITLTTSGTGGSGLAALSGTEHPFNHVFSRNITIGDGDGSGGRIELFVSRSSLPIASVQLAPSIIINESEYFGTFRISPARITSTTSTTIGQRQLGSWNTTYQFQTGLQANRPYMAFSSSASPGGSTSGVDRRISINGAFHTSWRDSDADITVATSDHTIVATVSSGTQTITLPDVSGLETGRQIVIMKENAAGTLVVAEPTTTGNIVRPGGGTGNRTTTSQYAQIVLYCDGNNNWYAQEWGTWT